MADLRRWAKDVMRTWTIIFSITMLAIAGALFASRFTPSVVKKAAVQLSILFPVVALPSSGIGLWQVGKTEKKKVSLVVLHTAAFVAAGYFLYVWISFFAGGGIGFT